MPRMCRGTVSISLILVAGCHGPSPSPRVSGITSGHAAGHQAHEVERADFGFQPPRQADPGLGAAKPILQPVVEAGTLGCPWLRTNSCQRATRCHSSFRTSGYRRTRPCITASPRASRTGPASGGRARARRCRMGSRTRSRWVGRPLRYPGCAAPRCAACSRRTVAGPGPPSPGLARRPGRRRSSALAPRAGPGP